MNTKTLERLQRVDLERSLLVRKMMTYLNHLHGSVERGSFPESLRDEERFLEARLGRLGEFPKGGSDG